ncbi:unnamed protein product [Arctia plantaginis]|uniref:snRNA-activating protein complex subunit 3 n=1 Tax=Arctia plantaginis TaxID=874455 RepID=A0A8S1AE87_ARCPL|nr:unnamed protein product [Arctia plantaginis]
MSNVNEIPGVSQDTDQDTPEIGIFSEDISSATYHANRSERIISQSEEGNTTDDDNTEVIEIVINTDGEDGEFNISLSELIKSPHSTKSEDDNFKVPLMITAPKGKGKKTRSLLQTDDSTTIKSPHKKTPESTLSGSKYFPTDPQISTSENVVLEHSNVVSNVKGEPSNSHNHIKPEMTNDGKLECNAEPISSITNVPVFNRKRVNLYDNDTGPQMYMAKGNLVTRPIITKNLPKVFQYLPIYGKPGPNTTLEEFYTNKVRDFVGFDLNDEEFEDLENYCSPELLKTGKEIKMQTSVPVMGIFNSNTLDNKFTAPDVSSDPPNLVTYKKFKLRVQKDTKGLYIKKLKYRGVRMLPCVQEQNTDESNPSTSSTETDEELEPGVDILYRVRIYRPYTYNMVRDRYTRSRHSVFCCDVVVTGRHKLTALRDRFVCHNDFDLRVDVSNHPDMLPTAKAKEVFPSGFLFINNVFYVDTREGCVDYSAPIREWARARQIGDFPARDMGHVRLHQLVLKLGYPESPVTLLPSPRATWATCACTSSCSSWATLRSVSGNLTAFPARDMGHVRLHQLVLKLGYPESPVTLLPSPRATWATCACTSSCSSWATLRSVSGNLTAFPARDMGHVRLHQLVLKLGYPESPVTLLPSPRATWATCACTSSCSSWATLRSVSGNLTAFPARDMGHVRLHQLVLKLGYPESPVTLLPSPRATWATCACTSSCSSWATLRSVSGNLTAFPARDMGHVRLHQLVLKLGYPESPVTLLPSPRATWATCACTSSCSSWATLRSVSGNLTAFPARDMGHVRLHQLVLKLGYPESPVTLLPSPRATWATCACTSSCSSWATLRSVSGDLTAFPARDMGHVRLHQLVLKLGYPESPVTLLPSPRATWATCACTSSCSSWATLRSVSGNLTAFPARDMGHVRLHQLVLKLGYPESPVTLLPSPRATWATCACTSSCSSWATLRSVSGNLTAFPARDMGHVRLHQLVLKLGYPESPVTLLPSPRATWATCACTSSCSSWATLRSVSGNLTAFPARDMGHVRLHQLVLKLGYPESPVTLLPSPRATWATCACTSSCSSWATLRSVSGNLTAFPARDMGHVRLHQLVLKLGYPEVYVHQGNCEHVFVFSEVRLLNANDPLRFSSYPFSTAIGQNQTVYCTTCAEFSAKWIVVGSDRVPFDPGFFCDTCFKQYMYKDGQKIGQFKAYRYRGNALNVLKPL